MLKKINEGGVESDGEFLMQFVHPEYLEYKDNELFLEIPTGDSPQGKELIYVSSIKGLNDLQRKRITDNINKALKLLEGKFEIV